MRNLAVLASLCLMCAGMPVQAATVKDDLEQTHKEIEQTRKEQGDLEQETKKVEAELRGLQEKLVKSAAEVQKAETELSDAEDKLRILGEQLKTKEEAIKARRKHLSALVNAALTLSHTPPEAVVMMPGDPTETMKAARALKMASESIRQETQSLGLQMAELEKLKAKVTAHRDQLAARQTALEKERHELVDEISKRNALQAKLGLQQKETAARLAKLAKKADDLKELVSGIEEEGNAAPERPAAKPAPSGPHGRLRSFEDAKGRIHSPVAGDVVQGFGVSQGKNSTSKGITLVARRGAKVVAPFDGEVVFTGPFLNYGQMVIIRHSDEFHTLVAGLAKIDTSVGQFLLEGEPIGAMGDSDSGNNQEHKLYIELRKDNQPVDPAAWIGKLNKKN